MRGRHLADFSTPCFHKIAGFDHFPVLIPSIPEPHVTIEQYLSFARLKPGDIVFDLGVYAGITSIVFSQTVGPEGAVFGFEADSTNFEAASENLKTARRFGAPNNTVLVQKAVWCHGNGLEFSSEGAMGSSAAAIVGSGRGEIVTVPTTTRSDFCAERGIDRIDFIKMDIEGAEIEVLESSRQLLSQVRPRLIIEPHYVNGELTADRCCAILESIGYTTQMVVQHGVSLPLIEASPR
jgi:FkbM family methyltransferase